MEAGEINKCVGGQEEVGDDGRDDIQLRWKRSRISTCTAVQLRTVWGWTAAEAWKLSFSWKLET